MGSVFTRRRLLVGLSTAVDRLLCGQSVLAVRQCTLISKEIRWCGLLLSAEGITFDPRGIDGLQQMAEPTDGAQRQQLFCALQWVKTGIPNFNRIVEPLHEFLEKDYVRSKTHKKRSLARISMADVGWDQTELQAFKSCTKALSRRVTLTHRDATKRVCVYSDSSNSFWSGIITQVPAPDMTLPVAEQPHEPLALHSRKITLQ